jgi:hypothetical protein
MGKCSPAHIVLCNESTLQAQIPYLLWGQIDCWGGLRFPAVVNFRWPCSWTLLRFFLLTSALFEEGCSRPRWQPLANSSYTWSLSCLTTNQR